MSNNIFWSTEKCSLKDLVPASYNPRKLTKKQYDDLRASLEKFNLAELPVVNTDMTILAGHMRVRLMTDLYGKDYVIEIRKPNRFLTEEEAKEYNIRSNKNTGEWDFDLLANEFSAEELQQYGFQEYELGFMSEKEVLMDKDDLTKTLDSYLDGNIKQITLYFKNEDYEDIINRIKIVMDREGIEDHSAAFIKILEFYEKNLS